MKVSNTELKNYEEAKLAEGRRPVGYLQARWRFCRTVDFYSCMSIVFFGGVGRELGVGGWYIAYYVFPVSHSTGDSLLT